MMDITRKPDESIELGSIIVETGKNPVASIIWLHGLGADGGDFESIVPQLRIPASLPIRFIFPDAPVRPVSINSGMMMRAWYDIYEDIDEGARQDEQGIRESATVVRLLIEQQVEEGVMPEHIILAGFSQGGAIALYAGLTSGFSLAGIMALSAYLPLAETFQEIIPAKQRLSVLMAHGQYDQVIPIRLAEHACEQLRKLDLKPQFNRYKMAHEVCAEETVDIREWLLTVLSRQD